MSREGGYPLEWFAGVVQERFKCGICHQVLREAVATSCGHIYCSGCLSWWIRHYGVCPLRCRELETDSLKRVVQMDRLISGLAVHCKNRAAGCGVVVCLAEKHLHETTNCAHAGAHTSGLRRLLSKLSLSQQDLSEGSKYKVRHKRTKSSGSPINALARRSPSSAAALCRPSTAVPSLSVSRAMPVAMNSKGLYSVHTFRLKRTKTKEPLGLVLVSGEKTSDGRPINFLVKKVHPDTLGWRAGLQADDRIVQVDNHDLTSISPPEAVARIKEKTLVTLTVHRGIDADNHVYDEIFYSDLSQQTLSQNSLSQNLSQNLSQQDENMSSNFSGPGRHKGRVADEMMSQRYQQRSHPHSPAPLGPRGKQTTHRPTHHQHTMEKGSKDSGLSSGSSTHQEQEEQGAKHGRAYRSRTASQGSQRSQGSQGSHWAEHRGNPRCRIEGNYEVEEIYLQKNGTNQLGITLGYDTKSSGGQLVVCEVLPNGLAAQNGRLRSGDIVRRVNEFEVHNPEEAILLFLEQDQDITLTVARPLQQLQVAPSNRLRSAGSTSRLHPEGTRPHPDSHWDNRTYAVLDGTTFRRVDSCGALDTRRHPSPVMGGMARELGHASQSMSVVGGGEMRRTKSASSTSRGARKRDVLKSRSPPARQPSPLVTDTQQQPVYNVLQQPGSPGEGEGGQEPVYHILQQEASPRQLISPQPPVYQVLQHPHSPSPPPPSSSSTSKQPPVYQVLECQDNRPIAMSRSSSGGKTKGSSHNLHSKSTTPHHHKHRLDTTEGGLIFAPQGSPMCKMPSSHSFCSVSSDMRSDVSSQLQPDKIESLV